MLIWMTALHCEAKPIIDFYRLKKLPQHHAFDVYQNQNLLCVISGIGKIAAAAATAWIAALQQQHASIAWINIGTAGAEQQAIGSAFWVSKIGQPNSKKFFYPVPTFASGFEIAVCESLDRASTDYHSSHIYDMEASAFFDTATRFSSAELVHCLKIISDNNQQQTGFDKAAISDLIHHHISAIDQFAQQLIVLNQQISQLQIDPADWQFFLQQAHFSQTQKAMLKTRLAFLTKQKIDCQALFTEIKPLTQSKAILQLLDQRCFDLSRDL